MSVIVLILLFGFPGALIIMTIMYFASKSSGDSGSGCLSSIGAGIGSVFSTIALFGVIIFLGENPALMHILITILIMVGALSLSALAFVFIPKRNVLRVVIPIVLIVATIVGSLIYEESIAHNLYIKKSNPLDDRYPYQILTAEPRYNSNIEKNFRTFFVAEVISDGVKYTSREDIKRIFSENAVSGNPYSALGGTIKIYYFNYIEKGTGNASEAKNGGYWDKISINLDKTKTDESTDSKKNGANSGKKENIVGVWEYISEHGTTTYEFNSDGTFGYAYEGNNKNWCKYSGTYNIDEWDNKNGGNLTLNVDNDTYEGAGLFKKGADIATKTRSFSFRDARDYEDNKMRLLLETPPEYLTKK